MTETLGSTDISPRLRRIAELANQAPELAFTTLFGSFGESFHRTYRELTGGPDREFWRVRRDVYNVYPLLVHVRLFGGSYVGSVERILDRFGV